MMSGISWSPGIGDPTWIGWLITVAYLVSAVLCFRAFSVAAVDVRRIWLVLGIGMLLLGFNKQLDLQELLKEIGKRIAYRDGWYAQRRQVQAVFAATVIGVGMAATIRTFLVARRQSKAVQLSLLGTGLILAFIAMRVALFEHLGLPFLGENVNALVELSGITCVALGSVAAVYDRRL